ncbi:hypothetical protein VTL71DRAFT_12072 [Oculimacula yallundae]|uniref:Uncharacterized protein n=1 Tax=Oculimacula yallundae TaxID=86028 RepID=A0ABR4CRW7_9HELO
MCFSSKRRPRWEEDVVFANRRHGHRHRISETIITSRPISQMISAPPTPPPVIIQPAPTPSPPPALPSPPSPPRVELVSVEEDIRCSSSPRTSVSVSTHKKSRHGGSSRGGGGGEEVYIERERIRERMPPPPPPPQVPTREEFDTYRYVPGSGHMESPQMSEHDLHRRRSRSITYESNPRVSGRVTERERVVIEGDGRRKEYYRRP